MLDEVGVVVGLAWTSRDGHLDQEGGNRAHSGPRVSAMGGKTFLAK